MFSAEGSSDIDVKSIGRGIYERILASMQKYGPVPLNQVTRIGTVN